MILRYTYNYTERETLSLQLLQSTDASSSSASLPLQPSQKSIKKFHLVNDKFSTKIPTPFPFPRNYPPVVESALNEKVVPPEVLSRFLHSIAQAIYAIKCYPTSQEYESIGLQVVERYPFLESPAGGACVSSIIMLL